MPTNINPYQSNLEYHRDHRAICRFLLSPAGDIYFYNQMIESIAKTIRRNFQRNSIQQKRDTAYAIHFVAAGFVAAVQEWLRKDDCTPQQLAELLLSMIMKLQ